MLSCNSPGHLWFPCTAFQPLYGVIPRRWQGTCAMLVSWLAGDADTPAPTPAPTTPCLPTRKSVDPTHPEKIQTLGFLALSRHLWFPGTAFQHLYGAPQYRLPRKWQDSCAMLVSWLAGVADTSQPKDLAPHCGRPASGRWLACSSHDELLHSHINPSPAAGRRMKIRFGWPTSCRLLFTRRISTYSFGRAACCWCVFSASCNKNNGRLAAAVPPVRPTQLAIGVT